MNTKQKIVNGRGSSDKNLGSFDAPLMFGGLHNYCPLLTMSFQFQKALERRTNASKLSFWFDLKI